MDKHTIQLNCIVDLGRVLAVLPSTADYDRLVASLEQQKPEDETQAEMLEVALVRARNERAALDSAVEGMVEVREYRYVPYTYGQLLECKRAATRWENGEPRIDFEEYQLRLTAMAIGMEYHELLALDPAVVPALVAEVQRRQVPDPEKVRFLGSSPTASGAATRSTSG